MVNEHNKENYKNIDPGNYIEIRIKDSGIGIPSNNLQKIFDPGFSTKEKAKESGLGLNIIKEIITDHNGLISVASTLNKGSEFTIILPAIEKKESFIGSPDKTILIAEDEETLQELLSELLESYNYNVIKASNGNEVLNLLEGQGKIDLLIIDYKMPDLDGIECIKKIKGNNITIPIILSSGSGTAATKEEIEKLNVEKVLIKPYDFEKLLDIIQELVT